MVWKLSYTTKKWQIYHTVKHKTVQLFHLQLNGNTHDLFEMLQVSNSNNFINKLYPHISFSLLKLFTYTQISNNL